MILLTSIKKIKTLLSPKGYTAQIGNNHYNFEGIKNNQYYSETQGAYIPIGTNLKDITK